jgi:FkbM family methyltransferase
MISYAQNFEDVILARVLADRNVGFYIDIGACFPDIASVTKHFYDRGWSGVNVEPMAEPFKQLVTKRMRDVNLNIAIAGYSGTIMIFHGPSVGESSAIRTADLEHSVSVPCLTLADLCRQYATHRVDFLKIDAEGLERDIVLSGDWDCFRPTIVLIEVTEPWTTTRRPESAEVSEYLGGKGYSEVYFDGINVFYLAAEAHDLAPRFSCPPNVLDHFVSPREGRVQTLERELRQSHTRLAESCARLQTLESELTAVYRSPSWRLTKPFRVTGAVVKRFILKIKIRRPTLSEIQTRLERSLELVRMPRSIVTTVLRRILSTAKKAPIIVSLGRKVRMRCPKLWELAFAFMPTVLVHNGSGKNSTLFRAPFRIHNTVMTLDRLKQRLKEEVDRQRNRA